MSDDKHNNSYWTKEPEVSRHTAKSNGLHMAVTVDFTTDTVSGGRQLRQLVVR